MVGVLMFNLRVTLAAAQCPPQVSWETGRGAAGGPGIQCRFTRLSAASAAAPVRAANPRTRRWAQRGTRPRALADLRTQSADLFGAICPERGAGAAVVMPRADTPAMQHHLDEIARTLAPKAYAIVVLDQAGWHTTGKLRIPENLSLLPLPPKSPELNPVENVWQFLRQNKLSNRIFGNYEAIVTAACEAWNSLIADPARITSIGTRPWATIAPS